MTGDQNVTSSPRNTFVSFGGLSFLALVLGGLLTWVFFSLTGVFASHLGFGRFWSGFTPCNVALLQSEHEASGVGKKYLL